MVLLIGTAVALRNFHATATFIARPPAAAMRDFLVFGGLWDLEKFRGPVYILKIPDTRQAESRQIQKILETRVLETFTTVDLQKKKDKLTAFLETEWNWYRYGGIKTHSVQNHADIQSFWQARRTLIYDTVCTYLFHPTTTAAIERSFSLAELVDTKNRTKMGGNLQQAAVMMFCNVGLEGRVTTPK